jgi:hypothetical protein
VVQSPAGVKVSPNPFKVNEGETTSVVYVQSAEPQEPAGKPPVLPPYTTGGGGGTLPYYPQTAETSTTAESWSDKLKNIWYRWKAPILFVGIGAGAFWAYKKGYHKKIKRLFKTKSRKSKSFRPQLSELPRELEV